MAETYEVRLIIDGGRNGKDLGSNKGDGRDGDEDGEKVGGGEDKGEEDDDDKDNDGNYKDDGGNSIVRAASDRHKGGTTRCNGVTIGGGANRLGALA